MRLIAFIPLPLKPVNGIAAAVIYQYNKRQNLYNVIGSKNSDYSFTFTSHDLFSTIYYNKPLNDEKIILNNANFVCSGFSDIKSEEEVNNN